MCLFYVDTAQFSHTLTYCTDVGIIRAIVQPTPSVAVLESEAAMCRSIVYCTCNNMLLALTCNSYALLPQVPLA
jgi:hypothetical protein